MRYAHPSVLWMLAGGIPVLAGFLWWAWRKKRRLIAAFVPPRLQHALTIGVSPGRTALRASLWVLGIAALLLALARPRWGTAAVEVRQRGLDVIVAIDTSRSMLAEDAGTGTSRLGRAKLAALDLARLARSDRLGLVAFAGSAFLQCPLTIDDDAFRQSIDALDTTIIPQGGTAIAQAIQTALEAFGADTGNLKVLVLFTDGEDHEAGALDAARRAATRDMRIFTVGVGTPAGEIIRIPDDQGNMSYLKDADGNVVKSSLNEAHLREIAATTGGAYLPLRGADAMTELYTNGLAPLPKADLSSRVFDQLTERFQWPLALALALLLAETLLPECRRLRGVARPSPLAHPALGRVATVGMLVLLAPGAFGSARSALKSYQAGEYGAAQNEFERLAERRPEEPRLRFNAGTAAYRAGSFEGAIKNFAGALATGDLDLQHDAYYNLGNAEFNGGEQTSDLNARAAAWQRAIQRYEAALKLDANDADARHNLEYVRRKLDELRQQQQQQQDQQQQKKQDQKQDKQEPPDPQQQSSSNPQDKSQPENQPPEPSPSQDQKPQPKPDADPQADQSSQEDSKPEQQKPDERQERSQAQKEDSKDGQSKDEPAPSNPADQVPPVQMTPRQAMQLLDTLKGEERPMPLEKRRARVRVVKDW